MSDAKEDCESSIKTMQLYSHIDRIWNELSEMNYDRNSDEFIPVPIMNMFDCYNYSGMDGAKRAAEILELSSNSRVVDIGSGLGGPGRCISNTSGATVIGIEMQSDLAELANELSRRCSIADRVKVIPGDFTDKRLEIGDDGTFDAVVSWLVILHIPLNKRSEVFSRAFDLLRPGGKVYIEDFYFINEKGPFTDIEQKLLREEVFVPDSQLPSRTEYIETLQSAGFEVDFQDVTEEWRAFTAERLCEWRRDEARHVRVHNLETWEALDRFYSAIVELFQCGRLGGVKILLRKPL